MKIESKTLLDCSTNAEIYDMRVNSLISPIGIDDTNPVFSWKIASDVKGWLQSAYRIQINNDVESVWDSGKVTSESSVGITYDGKALKDSTCYHWTVTVWDQNGNESTNASTFETGLFGKNAFSDAFFISGQAPLLPKEDNSKDCLCKSSLPVFRKEIGIKDGLVSAKLYTTGLGVYEAYVNGERIGRKYPDGTIEYHELKPGFTEMGKRRLYSSYDITWMMKNGSNTISAVVSAGWWSDQAARFYGKKNAFLAKLILTYADGSKETITTDETWKTANKSPIMYADIFTGESYDARVSTDWMKNGYDDSAWENASVNNEFKGEIVSWRGSYITIRQDRTRTVQYVKVFNNVTGKTENSHGKINVSAVYGNEPFTLNKGDTAVIDFGQNFAGFEAIEVEGKSGTLISIKHGEILNDKNGEYSRGCDGAEGSIYNANYRSAKATTHYILNGCGIESYHPSMTFYGFRYIEISATETITVHSVKGMVVTSVEKDTGSITTSSDDVNKLISNIRWGQYSNYLSVPTDCPQRDERQGWTADTQVFSKAGCYMGFSKSFLEKFMVDMRDSQNSEGAYPGTAPTGEYNGADWGGHGWADAGIIVPYTLYMMYGDTSVIKENWKSMKLYVDGFLSKTGKNGPLGIWGDWLSYEPNDDQIKELLGVAFYAWDALLMSKMADALGLSEESIQYNNLYKIEKDYFIEKFVSSDGNLKLDRQTACLYALYLDLLPDEDSVLKVTDQLINNINRNGNKLQTGFLGTAIIMETLTKIGRSDVAYTLLLQHNNPSWLYSVDQGATTIWERWNSYTLETGFGDVGMNSFNHYAYGAVASWMFGSMAGIGYDTTNPGFKNIVIAPQPDPRLNVEACYDSAYGDIKAKSVICNNVWTYSISTPANTTADIIIPTVNKDSVTINGKSIYDLTIENDRIKLVSENNGKLVFKAVSDSFVIISTIQ